MVDDGQAEKHSAMPSARQEASMAHATTRNPSAGSAVHQPARKVGYARPGASCPLLPGLRARQEHVPAEGLLTGARRERGPGPWTGCTTCTHRVRRARHLEATSRSAAACRRRRRSGGPCQGRSSRRGSGKPRAVPAPAPRPWQAPCYTVRAPPANLAARKRCAVAEVRNACLEFVAVAEP